MDLKSEVKARLSCEDVARRDGLTLKDSGQTWDTAIRAERTPSAKIYRDPARGWFDFGAGVGGDCISLHMAVTGKPFRDALAELAGWCGIDSDDVRDELQSMTRAAESRKELIHRVHHEARTICRMCAERHEAKSATVNDDEKRILSGKAEALRAFDTDLPGDTLSDEQQTRWTIECLRYSGGDGASDDADRLLAELGDDVPAPVVDVGLEEDGWDDVKPDPPKFVWYPFIPHGKLTVISARGGAGKGMFACLMAARISKGLNFSDLERERYPHHALDGPAHVLYLSRGEDSRSVIQARFLDSGGARGYFHVFTEENKSIDLFKLKLDEPDGFKRFHSMVRKYDAQIVILDTMDKFLSANENRKDEVQDALTKLQGFATAEGISLIGIMHDRKGGSGGNMVDRVAGSREWTDVPRSVLHMDFDPEDPAASENRRNTNRRVVIPSKNNLAAWGSLKSIRFIIDGPMGAGFGRFPTSEEVPLDADVTADDYELADIRKTTVRAVLMEKNRARLTAEARGKALKEALQSELAEMREQGETRRRFSYGEFESKHGGKSVWGGEAQRVKAIEFVKDEFTENGVFISTHGGGGKPIRGRDGSAGLEIMITTP